MKVPTSAMSCGVCILFTTEVFPKADYIPFFTVEYIENSLTDLIHIFYILEFGCQSLNSILNNL